MQQPCSLKGYAGRVKKETKNYKHTSKKRKKRRKKKREKLPKNNTLLPQ